MAGMYSSLRSAGIMSTPVSQLHVDAFGFTVDVFSFNLNIFVVRIISMSVGWRCIVGFTVPAIRGSLAGDDFPTCGFHMWRLFLLDECFARGLSRAPLHI
ncbi:MAG TPA: hypothetical protein VHV10_03800 [Ktedonobacteraceae bacterium]|nr:hypothetical protein [Ktedonobacteraceae bacterium]